MTATDTDTSVNTTAVGDSNAAADAPAYPVPRPGSGDDPRFCFGLAYDVGKVLHQYGFPPALTGRDIGRIKQAVFRLIYQVDHL